MHHFYYDEPCSGKLFVETYIQVDYKIKTHNEIVITI